MAHAPMSVKDRKNVLSSLKVREAMRRIAVHLPESASVDEATRCAIKFKVSAILITGREYQALGVVSKTDLMCAYYAGLPLETPVSTIMRSPPLFCGMDDSLDAALDTMRSKGVHRLYVRGDDPDQAIGILAYPDIVGLLYRYCHKCEHNTLRTRKVPSIFNFSDTFKVRDVMNPSLLVFREEAILSSVMEGLSAHRIGAVLIRGRNNLASGVVSKTDLIMAYRHGIPPTAEAATIMSSPVRSCDHNEQLVSAIQKMIFSDVHRFFVYRDNPDNIVGVLTLTDAARVRSGSCRACVSSRIRL